MTTMRRSQTLRLPCRFTQAIRHQATQAHAIQVQVQVQVQVQATAVAVHREIDMTSTGHEPTYTWSEVQKQIEAAIKHDRQQRTWVGLTLADKDDYLALDFGGNRLDAMDWAARKLKEKNNGC
jgi:hypothetical protein